MKRIFLAAAMASVALSGLILSPALAYPPPDHPAPIILPVVAKIDALEIKAHDRELQNGESIQLPAGRLKSAPGLVQTVYWDRRAKVYVAEQGVRETRYLVNPVRYVMIGVVQAPDQPR